MMINKDGLKVPHSFSIATNNERAMVVNKCGPDGWLSQLIPDHLLGVDISRSCNIHDWMVEKAKSKSELLSADWVFLENMTREVDKASGSPLGAGLRRALAYLYFGAVRVYSGLKSF